MGLACDLDNTNSRIINGRTDIGCYEYGTVGNTAPTVNAGNDQTITWPTRPEAKPLRLDSGETCTS